MILVCSDTKPAFLASVVAKWPLICFILLFILMLLFAAPTVLLSKYRPKMNNDFESLQVKDDETAQLVAAVRTLDSFNKHFWNSNIPGLKIQAEAQQKGVTYDELKGDSQRRGLLALPGRCARGDCTRCSMHEAVSTDAQRPQWGRRLLEAAGTGFVNTLSSVSEGSGVLSGFPLARSLLQRQKGVINRPRTEFTRGLHIFYRYADNSTSITDSLVNLVRLSCC